LRYLLLVIILISNIILSAQEIELDIHDPFETSLNYVNIDCIFSYEDLTVYHPEWGIVLLDTDEFGEPEEISRLYTGQFPVLARRGNYLYLANYDLHDYEVNDFINIKIFDINDPQNPFQCDELELTLTAYSNHIYSIDDYLYVTVPDLGQYCRINPENNSIDGYYSYSGFIKNSFNDNLLGVYSLDHYVIYQSGADGLEIIAHNYDLYEAHQQQEIRDIYALADNIVCTIGVSNIVIWDISDISNWIQLDYWETDNGENINQCSTIAIIDNWIYVNSIEYVYALGLDENYEISETAFMELPFTIYSKTLGYLDNRLLIPDHDGLSMVSVNGDDMEWAGIYGDTPIFYNHSMVGDDYFVMSRSYYYYSGIKRWNISDPWNTQFEESMLPECDYLLMRSNKDFFGLHDYWNSTWDIYQYRDEEMYLLTTLPVTGNDEVYILLKTDESEENSLYITNSVNYNIKKYDLVGNELIQVMDNDFNGQQCGFIENGLGYFITNDYSVDLIIYEGFDVEQPVIIQEYENILMGDGNSLCKVNDQYLAVMDVCASIDIYGYDGCELTGQSFSLSTYNGTVFQSYEDYIICCDMNYLYFYRIDGESSGMLEPDQQVEMMHLVTRMILKETDDGDFLFCFGPGAVSVVEMSISNDVLDTKILDDPLSIKAFPNPVYSSYNGKVNFQLSEQTRLNQNNGEISVYNIKGQLVHRQKVDFTRDGSLQWDCRLESGNEAPSGVYLYRVGAGEESSVGKFIIAK